MGSELSGVSRRVAVCWGGGVSLVLKSCRSCLGELWMEVVYPLFIATVEFVVAVGSGDDL